MIGDWFTGYAGTNNANPSEASSDGKGLTLQSLLAMKSNFERELRRVTGIEDASKGAFADAFGVPVIVSDHCMVRSKAPAFPVSRHRSRRVHKKLEKRFGPQFPMEPASFLIGDRLVMHPSHVFAIRGLTT